MKVCYICGYWSKLTDTVLGRRPEDYRNAYLYVWAVKHGTFLKNFYVITKDGQRQPVRADNIATARKRFGSFVEQRIEEHGWDEDPLLVAVPSSTAFAGATTSRSTAMLTEAMSHTPYANSLSDAVRWRQRMTEQHKGGERGRAQAVQHLTCADGVQGRCVVLIEDLVTRGGTLLATKDVLEGSGAKVLGAITVGRTMYQRDIKAFGSQWFDLTAELADFDKGQR